MNGTNGVAPPTAVKVNPASIPQDLTSGRQFVNWRWEQRTRGNGEKKWTKPPYQPSGHFASSTDADTWSTFDEVVRAYAHGTGEFAGIGRVLTLDDGLVGIDLDHVRDLDTGTITEQASRIVDLLSSYTEVSPSGCGLRIFIKARLARAHNKNGIEVYASGRYLTLTGFHLPGTPRTVERRQVELEAFCTTYFDDDSGKTERASSSSQKQATTEIEIEEALHYISSPDDRDTWLRVGMALHKELGESGRSLWDAWSQRSAKYDARDQQQTWRHFNQNGNAAGSVGIGTVFELAKQGGWQRSRSASWFTSDGLCLRSTETAEIEIEPDPPAPYSDIALSNRFITQYGEDLRHVKSVDDWFVYNDGLWCQDDKLLVFTLAKRLCVEAARELYEKIMNAPGATDENEQERRKQASTAANALASSKKVWAIVSLARSHPKVAVTLDVFDRDAWLLNTPAGVVNLRDGTIRPAHPDDYFTKRTAVGPARIDTPIFDRFLREIMGEHVPVDICICAACATSKSKPADERKALHLDEVGKLARYLKRFYSYCLTADVREHVLAFQIGEGGNGKGVLNDLMGRDILGASPVGYWTELPMEALLNTGFDRHPTELMDLFRARLATARESDEGVRWNEGRVKRLTGGDVIKARRMRQDFVQFDPTHKLVSFMNTNPVIRGADQAAWRRRLQMVPFQQKWEVEPDPAKNVRKADKDLGDKLRVEAPGILQTLIDECLNYQKSGLEPPLTVRQVSEAYLLEQNIIARFVEEMCDRDNPSAMVTVNELWAACEKWAGENQEHIGRRIDFNAKLEKQGIKIERTGGKRGICKGISLVGEPEQRDRGEGQ